MLTADRIRALLNLEPHPLEGGFFAETWRARQSVAAADFDPAAAGDRAAGTAIYYLLTAQSYSTMHRLRWDEVFHFYLGDPVELLLLGPGDEARVVTLGPAIEAGMRPQIIVPAGVWQGARLVTGGATALLGTTMAPGFDAADFEVGDSAALMARWPAYRGAIAARTRPRE